MAGVPKPSIQRLISSAFFRILILYHGQVCNFFIQPFWTFISIQFWHAKQPVLKWPKQETQMVGWFAGDLWLSQHSYHMLSCYHLDAASLGNAVADVD